MKLLIFLSAVLAPALTAFAGTAPIPGIPALDDAGLLILSTILGLGASWAIKRSKKK